MDQGPGTSKRQHSSDEGDCVRSGYYSVPSMMTIPMVNQNRAFNMFKPKPGKRIRRDRYQHPRYTPRAPRLLRVPTDTTSSTTIIGSSGSAHRHTAGNRTPRPTSTLQKSHVMIVQASSLKKKEIEEYFPNVEFVCPSNVHPGDDLNGATAIEILQDLLDDMKTKQFPMSAETVEDIQEVNLKRNRVDEVETVIRMLEDCLEKVPYIGNNITQVRATYENLKTVLERVDDDDDAPNNNISGYHITVRLRQFIASSLETSKNDPYGYLLKFWDSVFSLLEGVQTNGAKRFEITVKRNAPGPHTPVYSYVTKPDNNLPKLRKVGVVYPEDDDRQEGLSNVLVHLALGCKPDAVINSVERVQSGELQKHQRTKLVCQVKTSKKAVGSTQDLLQYNPGKVADSLKGPVVSPVECIASPASSPGRHDPEYKAPNEYSNDHYRLDSTSFSQVFVQLVGTLRTTPVHMVQRHVYGVYCVMHRVYITCLHVQVHAPKPKETDLDFIKGGYIRQERYNIHGADPKVNFRLVCSRPFNILKPGHFRALFQFIKYLVLRE